MTSQNLETRAAEMRERMIANRKPSPGQMEHLARIRPKAQLAIRELHTVRPAAIMPGPAPHPAPLAFVGTIRYGGFRTWTARMGRGAQLQGNRASIKSESHGDEAPPRNRSGRA